MATGARSRAAGYRRAMHELSGKNALLTGAAGGLGRHIAGELARRRSAAGAVGPPARAAPGALQLSAPARSDRRGGDRRSRRPTADGGTDRAGRGEDRAARSPDQQRRARDPGRVHRLHRSGTGAADSGEPRCADGPLTSRVARHARAGPGPHRHGLVAGGTGAATPTTSCTPTTKAGLVGFTRSLRAELADSPVGASVICPGFIARDGMYAEMQQHGVTAPLALRAVEPERVARAVLDAIVKDQPDVLITGWPMRPLLAIQEIAPRASPQRSSSARSRRQAGASFAPDWRSITRGRGTDRTMQLAESSADRPSRSWMNDGSAQRLDLR